MIVNRFRTFLNKFDHILLLVSLTLLVASPIWEKVFHLGFFLTETMIIVIIISGISVTYSHNHAKINLKMYFGLFTVFISLIPAAASAVFGKVFEQLVQFTQVIYFLVLTFQLFKLIINAEKVNTEVLINSVSGYLLIGLSWAILIMIWVGSFPNSFSFTYENELHFFNAIYYSFVTLTTLGYGDMLPVSASAKAYSVLIAISGAFYTTIVLGMIVGKYISNESIRKLNKNT